MEKEKCQVCGRHSLVMRKCILCGKAVCPRCFRFAMGVCKICMPGQEGKQYDILGRYVD